MGLRRASFQLQQDLGTSGLLIADGDELKCPFTYDEPRPRIGGDEDHDTNINDPESSSTAKVREFTASALQGEGRSGRRIQLRAADAALSAQP
jgi:hypothetical protein